MQKRRFIGRGLCIPRTSFSVRPGVQFDRNLAAIRFVSVSALRTVMLAGSSHKAPCERPATEGFKLARIVANAIMDADMSVPAFAPVSCEWALAFLRTLKLEEVKQSIPITFVALPIHKWRHATVVLPGFSGL